jgi:hypothetical protein
MAFKRYAHAIVSKQDVHFDQWMEEIRKQHEGVVPKDYAGRVAKGVFRKCNPKQYLLSHATIVASVDTYVPKGATAGRKIVNGVQVEVKWPDYRIKPECHEIVNNNGDAWDRGLLLATYRTFIGAPNYLEHIQLPELSKGFIVDAIARDLGKTCYIDILVATDRKHRILVNDILSGQIDAMSMGCISLFTICTKCGNVAVDDSQLCPCVLYEGKGTKFLDEEGILHPIAELIGHKSVPDSNQFIEASWVRNPAFGGAARRNILNPEQEAVASQIKEAASIYELRQNIDELIGIKKAASMKVAQDEPPADEGPPPEMAEEPPADEGGSEPPDLGGGPGPSGEEPPAEPDEPPAEPDEPPAGKFDELLEKAQEYLLQSIVKGLEDKLKPTPEDVGSVTVPTAISDAGGVDRGQDNLVHSSIEFNRRLRKVFSAYPGLVKWASQAYGIVHEGGKQAIVASRMTPRDLLILSWIEDTVRSHKYPSDLYKVAMNVGPSKSYPSEASYLAACKICLGRSLTHKERQFFQWKGRIASLSIQF